MDWEFKTPSRSWSTAPANHTRFFNVASGFASLTFNPAGCDNCEYRAVVRNCADRTVSASAKLCSLVSGSTPPVISSPLASVEMKQLASASSVLTVQTQDPVSSATWYRRLGGGAFSTYTSGFAFNSTLRSSSVTAPGSSVGLYEYYATMTNCAGVSSNSSSFLVCSGSVPSGFSAAVNRTVSLGSLANFSFTASLPGSPPVTGLDWQESLDGGATFNTILTETNATRIANPMTLSVLAVDTSYYNRRYRVVLYNCYGNASSVAASLCTGDAPEVLVHPNATDSQFHGSVITLSASFNTSRVPPVTSATWQRSTNASCFTCWQSLPREVSVSTDFGTGISTLSYLGNSTINFNGNWFRAVFSSCLTSTASNPGFICQGTAPSVTSPLAPVVAYALTGRLVRLQAQATGSPTVSGVVWTEDQGNQTFIPIGTFPDYNVGVRGDASILFYLLIFFFLFFFLKKKGFWNCFCFELGYSGDSVS